MRFRRGQVPNRARVGTIGVMLAVTLVLMMAGSASASAEQAQITLGGAFTNPCNGDFVEFEASGLQVAVRPEGGGLIIHQNATGTGIDFTTGQTYIVTFNFTQMSENIDQSGSFNAHVTIVFVGAAETFIVQSVTQLNLRSSEPVLVTFTSVRCAGSGPTTF
jgi:hypothetical protein